MSFSQLQVGVTVKMWGDEISQYCINEQGDSAHPVYADSVFSVIQIDPMKIYSGPSKGWQLTEMHWLVTRVLKKDLDIPLETPTVLTHHKVSALRIDINGHSLRSDQKDFTFTCKVLNFQKGEYEVIKSLKLM